MDTTKKPDTTPICPKCGGKLVYDGKGLSCISCPYTWRKPDTLRKATEPGKKPEEK
jgi:tRNA(Ile2) C34 agmatinyltransferase TiaS